MEKYANLHLVTKPASSHHSWRFLPVLDNYDAHGPARSPGPLLKGFCLSSFICINLLQSTKSNSQDKHILPTGLQCSNKIKSTGWEILWATIILCLQSTAKPHDLEVLAPLFRIWLSAYSRHFRHEVFSTFFHHWLTLGFSWKPSSGIYFFPNIWTLSQHLQE